MEGIGIWIFLLLFYLMQAITKRKQRQQRQKQPKTPRSEPQPEPIPQTTGDGDRRPKPKPHRPVTLEDILDPGKLRDVLGIPQQPKPTEKQRPKKPKPTTMRPKSQPEMRKRWEEPQQSKPALQHEEARETVSKVASPDITDVDESATSFRSQRMAKSDITSDRFDQRKTAPGKKKAEFALDYFDEPEDIRNAIVLKEILDRPRAFRRQIR